MARPLTRLQAARTARVPLERVQPGSQLVFSQELVDLIVDELEEDVPALANLGLVSRAWYPRTRFQLFYSMIIGPKKPAEELKVLLNLLHKNPFLRQCIHQLHLANQPPTIWLGESNSGTSRRLAAFLSMLPSLTHLCVNGRSELYMPDASPSFQKSISTALKKPTLTHISLERITGMDVEFLAEMRNLESLCLNDVNTDVVPDLNTLDKSLSSLDADRGGYSRLDSLDVTHSGSALFALFFRAINSDLARILHPKDINVGTGGWTEEMEYAWDIFLQSGAQTVERLTVSHDGPMRFPLHPLYSERFPPSVFKLEPYTELTELTVMIAHGLARDPPDNPVPHLIAGLRSLSQSSSGPRNLRRINLGFYLHRVGGNSDVGETLRALVQETFWSELSRILASKERAFCQLQGVVVMLEVSALGLSQKAWEDTRDGVVAAMSELDEKDMLVVSTPPQ